MYFRCYLYIMCVELLIFGLYLHRCLSKKETTHPLFKLAELCFWVLVIEICRCYLILSGVFRPTVKAIWLYRIEMIPFMLVSYEIIRKGLIKLYHKVWVVHEDAE